MLSASRLSQLAVAAVFASLAGGCVIGGSYAEYDRHHHGVIDAAVVVDRPAPVYVAPAPVYVAPPPPAPVVVYQAPPEQVLVVQAAPPPVRVEVRPRMPAPGFVWVGGCWAVQRGQWVWVSGRWDRPPHAHAVYAPSHWERRGTEFHLVVGGWH
jgi:hypothetical protein